MYGPGTASRHWNGSSSSGSISADLSTCTERWQLVSGASVVSECRVRPARGAPTSFVSKSPGCAPGRGPPGVAEELKDALLDVGPGAELAVAEVLGREDRRGVSAGAGEAARDNLAKPPAPGPPWQAPRTAVATGAAIVPRDTTGSRAGQGSCSQSVQSAAARRLPCVPGRGWAAPSPGGAPASPCRSRRECRRAPPAKGGHLEGRQTVRPEVLPRTASAHA